MQTRRIDIAFAAAVFATLGEWDTPEDTEAWSDLQRGHSALEPFVSSEVEKRAVNAAQGFSTSLETNGEGSDAGDVNIDVDLGKRFC